MSHWIEFVYREFFDVPRSLVLYHHDRLVFLESTFSETECEFSDDYQLYLLPENVDLSGSWNHLAGAAIRRLGSIPIAHVQFDPSRRRMLNIGSLRQLLP